MKFISKLVALNVLLNALIASGAVWNYGDIGTWPPSQSYITGQYPPYMIPVPMEAIVSENPAQITLKIYSGTGPTANDVFTGSMPVNLTGTYDIYRKDPDTYGWGSPVGSVTVGAAPATWVDTNVAEGVRYEYGIALQGGSFKVIGNVIAGINVDCTLPRGRIALVVTNDIPARLPTEYAQYKADLIRDGWQVNEILVDRAGSYIANGEGPVDSNGIPTGPYPTAHEEIRAQLIDLYNTYPGELKNVVLIGQVPVARSGIVVGPDGHGNRAASGADAYYADMDGVWTDTLSNISYSTDIQAAVNLGKINTPGDGKFDPTYFYEVTEPNSILELGFGRIDFSNVIPAEYEAMRNYFNKLHRYKTASPDFRPGRKAIFRAGFGGVSQAFLSSMPGVLGMENLDFITSGDLPFAPTYYDPDSKYTEQKEPYLFYFKGNSGPSYSHGGRAVFWTGMQSNWGYWFEDAANSGTTSGNTMAWRLTEDNYTLSFTWYIALAAHNAPYLYHRFGMGGTAGDMMRVSMSENSQPLASGPGFVRSTPLFMNHIGDPALRIFMIPPPENLSVIAVSGHPQLTWDAAVAPEGEPPVIGYHVYRSTSADSPFERITTSLVTGTTYTDTDTASGQWVYQVKAVRLEETGGGTFYNASLAAVQGIDLTNGPSALAIGQTTLPQANWDSDYSASLAASGGAPAYTWSTADVLPKGLTLDASGAIFGHPLEHGTFVFDAEVTDALGQTAQAQITLIVDAKDIQLIEPEASVYVTPVDPDYVWRPNEGTTRVSAGPTFAYDTYLRFDLNELHENDLLEKAEVALFIDGRTPEGTDIVLQVSLVDDSGDNWGETTLDYQTRPVDNANFAPIVAGELPTPHNQLIIDITPLVVETLANDPEKLLNLRIHSSTPAAREDAVHICTRYSTKAARPKLIAQFSGDEPYTPPTDPGGPTTIELELTSDPADQSVDSSGGTIYVGQPTARVGAVGSGFIMPFWVPDLEGREIVAADIEVALAAAIPSWIKNKSNVDLYGVRTNASSPTVLVSDYNTGTLLVDDWFRVDTGLAQIQSTNAQALTDWLVSNVGLGQTYVFLMIKPDTAMTGNDYATFATGNASSGQPKLTLTLVEPISEETIDDWRQSFFGSPDNIGDAADDANPAGDGIANIIKYALGMNPFINYAHNEVTPHLDWDVTNGITFSFTINAEQTDVRLIIEISDDMAPGNWVQLDPRDAANQVEVVEDYPDAGVDTITLRVGTANMERRFLRIVAIPN